MKDIATRLDFQYSRAIERKSKLSRPASRGDGQTLLFQWNGRETCGRAGSSVGQSNVGIEKVSCVAHPGRLAQGLQRAPFDAPDLFARYAG